MTESDLLLQVQRYVEVRRTLGNRDQGLQKRLNEFVRFVAGQQGEGPIRAQMAVDWVCKREPKRGLGDRKHRLRMVRGFLLYLRAVLPETEIPGSRVLAPALRPKPYLYSAEEICRLIEAASVLKPIGSLRPHTYVTLIGLLASTGLRIGEAFRLTVSNVHLDEETPYLEIHMTKFRKSRLVPMHPTTAEKLRAYANARNRLCPRCSSDTFFVSRKGARLNYFTVSDTFATLKRMAGIEGSKKGRNPCFHGLRHTFTVNRLLEWYRTGKNINDLVATLSTYLGHAVPESTYWYLTATPELLAVAAERFADPEGSQ